MAGVNTFFSVACQFPVGKHMDKVVLRASDRLFRLVWTLFHLIFIRYSPVPFFTYRAFLFKLWGSEISRKAFIYPSVKVWDPRKLKMRRGSCIGPHVEIYNVCPVLIDENGLVSQYSYLCTASHDMNSKSFDLIGGKIFVGRNAWVCADCFVGPATHISDFAVCLARSVVVKNVDSFEIVGGNPAKTVNRRKQVE